MKCLSCFPLDAYDNGDGDYGNSLAIAELLQEGEVYCISHGDGLRICVLCNDLFMWGFADGEDLEATDIEILYRMHADDPVWGTSKWCCLHRKQRPQKPIEDDMRRDGVWDDAMEALPPNRHSVAP